MTRQYERQYKVTGWIDAAVSAEKLLVFLTSNGFELTSKSAEAADTTHAELGTIHITLADPHLIDGNVSITHAEQLFRDWLDTLTQTSDFPAQKISAQLDFFEEDGRLVNRQAR